jgi:DNA gyrase inhibitor GyrI
MYVDFVMRRAPKYRVAGIVYKGPWKENHLRAEFKDLTNWAKKNKVRTGKWIFRELPGKNRWEACLELKGKAKRSGRIRIRTLPATSVASVTFDPEAVSPRVVYHGLSDFLRWRKKDHTIKGVGTSREVYEGDPWTNPKAWSRATVEYTVRK